jgi:hypothetical protein
MSDHLDRAAEVIERGTADESLHDEMCGVCEEGCCCSCVVEIVGLTALKALDEAGLLASPERDAAVAAKALRDVESVCMTTDGDHLEGESEIPVGEVMRMILEAEEAFGIEREAGESDGDA